MKSLPPMPLDGGGRAPDLAQFRAFEAIYRHGSLTAAAQELGLTQPALSKSLGLLRRYYGDDLFARTKQGMRPSAMARRLADSVSQLLRLLDDDLRAHAGFDPATSSRVFKLSCTEVGAIHFMPRLMADVRESAPRVRWDVLPLPADGGAAGLAQGDIDLVFGASIQAAEGIVAEALYEVGYRCLVRDGHPRIGAQLGLTQFCAERHVVATIMDAQHGFSRVEQAIARVAGEDAIGLRVPSLLSAPFIVAQSDHIFTATALVAQKMAQTPGLRLLDCPLDLPPMQVCQYWHQRFGDDPAIVWLRGLVQRFFKHPG